mgnify:CR=1 FL=1
MLDLQIDDCRLTNAGLRETVALWLDNRSVVESASRRVADGDPTGRRAHSCVRGRRLLPMQRVLTAGAQKSRFQRLATAVSHPGPRRASGGGRAGSVSQQLPPAQRSWLLRESVVSDTSCE